MNSMPALTRADALAQVRLILAELPLDNDERDTLFRAVVEYSHAAATEVSSEAQRIVKAFIHAE